MMYFRDLCLILFRLQTNRIETGQEKSDVLINAPPKKIREHKRIHGFRENHENVSHFSIFVEFPVSGQLAAQ